METQSTVGPPVESEVGTTDGAAVGEVVGTTVGGLDGGLDGEPVGNEVAGEPVGWADVGDAVMSTQVCPDEVQSPSEQRWVFVQLQRCPSVVLICSQMPYSVASQPCDPSLQACRVGLAVGARVGAREGADVSRQPLTCSRPTLP